MKQDKVLFAPATTFPPLGPQNVSSLIDFEMNIIINVIYIIHGHHGAPLALCSSPLQLSVTLNRAAAG